MLVYIFVHICVCVNVCMCVHIHAYVCRCLNMDCARVRTCVRVHVSVYVCVCTSVSLLVVLFLSQDSPHRSHCNLITFLPHLKTFDDSQFLFVEMNISKGAEPSLRSPGSLQPS